MGSKFIEDQPEETYTLLTSFDSIARGEMAIQRMQHESSIGAEKGYTSYKWSLNDWSLLFDDYYSKNVQSPKFLLSGTEGCTCQLTLTPSDKTHGSKYGSVKLNLSDDMDLLVMVITVSLVNERMEKKSTVKSVYGKSVTQMYIYLNSVLGKTGIHSLTNDTLILFVEFTIVKSVAISSLSTERYIGNFTTTVRENLKEILDSKSLTDVIFVVGKKKLFAHKVILSANSEVFKAMFISGMKEEKESTVDIIDTEALVFEEFLNYLYSGQINDLKTMADKLIVVADKYQIHDLKELCENYMSAHLDNGNVIQYLIAAYKLCCNILKLKALNFIKANMEVLANTKDYKILLEYPTLIKDIFGK